MGLALRDATERLAARAGKLIRYLWSKAELLRLGNAYRVLYRCSRTLVGAPDERSLLDALCGALVASGDYGFAWIAYPSDRDDDRMRLVARAGRAGPDLIAALPGSVGTVGRADVWPDRPVGLRHLTARSTAQSPWSGAARRQGYRSAILLPLRLDGSPPGILGILSGTPDAFADGESGLLVDLVRDLACCIQTQREHSAVARASQCQREETERQIQSRLAATLHDGVSQTLLAVNLGLRQMQALARNGGRLEVQRLERLVADSAQALQELRVINGELHPALLERHSLQAAVCVHCRESAERTGIPVAFHTDETSLILSEQTKVQCFLAFREALSNALRHARASRVAVHLQLGPRGTLTLMVIDDGVGFVPRRPGARPAGLGLGILRERIASVQGRVDLRSRIGRGTLLRIRVPLSPGVSPCR